MTDLNTTNLGTNDFVPGPYIRMNVPFGASGPVAPNKVCLLMGNPLASSQAVSQSLTNTQVFGPTVNGFTVQSESDVIYWFGSGSELHKQFQAFSLNNSTNPLYFLPIEEAAGAAAADGYVGFSTPNGGASGSGYLVVYVADEFVQVPLSAGQSAVTIAVNVASAWNSLYDGQATALAATGGVTFTAKNKGPRSNAIPFAVQVNGTSTGVVSTAQSFAYFTGGTVEDNAGFTAALATIEPLFFDFISTGAEDATSTGNLGLLFAQACTSDSQPVPGKRQRVICGNTSIIGTAVTFAQRINNVRGGCCWEYNSNYTPAQLAAYLAGVFAQGESQTTPIINYDGLAPNGNGVANIPWLLSAPFNGFTTSRADIVTALVSGLSPVQTASNGSTYLVSACTMYSLNPQNNNTQDLRARDWCIQSIADYIGAQLLSMWNTLYQGKQIGNPPPPGQKLPTSQIVTSTAVQASINKVLLRAFDNGLLDDITDTLAATSVQRQSNPNSRFAAVVQIQPVVPDHQIFFQLNTTNFSAQ